jgi:hypothetical protein
MSKKYITEQKLNELYRRKSQIDAQISALSARKRLQMKKDMDRLTWKIGALVCDHLNAEPTLEAWVFRELPKRFSKRDQERKEDLLQTLFSFTIQDRP